MSIVLKTNTVNTLKKGTLLFEQDTPVTYIGALLRGTVQMERTGLELTLKPGSMIGISDAYTNSYLCNYIVSEDALVYAFSIQGEEDMQVFLSHYTEYRGITVSAQNRLVVSINQVREVLLRSIRSVYSTLKDVYAAFLRQESAYAIKIPAIEDLEPYDRRINESDTRLLCCAECAQIPLDEQKSYYEHCENLSIRENEALTGLICALLDDCSDLVAYAQDVYELIINKEETPFFQFYVDYMRQCKERGLFQPDQLKTLSGMRDVLLRTNLAFTQHAAVRLLTEDAKLESLYEEAQEIAKEAASQPSNAAASSEINEEFLIRQRRLSLDHSLHQILDYADLGEIKSQVFTAGIEYLLNQEDRLAIDDEMRKTKRSLAPIFYDIYEACFIKSHTETPPFCVELLLNFSYVDERLLEDEQLTFLCQTHNNGYRSVCRIFTMREWLEEIYSGRKEPSRNEFNEDYTEYLRIQKKEGKITAEEEERFNQDISEKLHFEIQNFFLSNMRAVNGQLSTFVPFLYKDIFYSAMDKLWLSKQTIADCIDQYRTIDYTVFLHDVMFSAPESGVEREYILKEIAPDLIILPVYGQNSSMWQEIEGRKRDSHARILFPTFSEGPLDDMVIKAFGRYRWELCRCVQGMAWNNIQEKSLTSEYVDYIQFYRKNRDLTDEKREKIKLQIQKAKNNSREIFVLDYEAWMKSEANGALKLNKIAREIIATYCPFNAETRERLERNPAFADACARQKRDAGKRAKTLDLKVRQIESNGCEVPQEMIQTLKYLTEY